MSVPSSLTPVIVFVDAGFVRETLRRNHYESESIENIVQLTRSGIQSSETIHKILYYDSEPFVGTLTRPDGKVITYEPKPPLLHKLAHEALFDIRRGAIRFRGWRLNHQGIKEIAQKPSAFHFNIEKHLEAHFEQKCVDVRIGLDIASAVTRGYIHRIHVITGDYDMAPAIKFARKNEIQVVLYRFNHPPSGKVSPIYEHADWIREVDLSSLDLTTKQPKLQTKE